MSEKNEIQISPIVEARHQLTQMEPQFKAALPAHIPAERFGRVVMTALQNNPDLVLKCDRRSLWNAAMRAAQDGLLPDGRDGAIVPFKGKAQWMPMIGGIRKKARNSGEIATWETACVYENDEFVFELGDAPFIRHRPALGDRGKIIAAYSVAKLKDGSLSREVMSIDEIEGVRGKSRAENGPWNDPIFYPEMVRKVVARRHSKSLPMSSDLDDLIRRDDDLYDLASAREAIADRTGGKEVKQTLAGKLDNLAALPGAQDSTPAQDNAPAEEEGATANTLIAAIEELPTMEATVEWGFRNSANIGHLSTEDGNKIAKALLARQHVILKKPEKEPARDSANGPFEEIPAMLRRKKNGEFVNVLAAG